MMDDETFMATFEAAAFPMDQWHHREHIKAAYLYLRRYPFDTALGRMKASILALNAAQQVPETPGRGYNETMTQAWLRLVHCCLTQYGPAATADRFYEEHPELSQAKILRLFYSKALLSSPRTKVEFVEPDLARLPEVNGAENSKLQPSNSREIQGRAGSPLPAAD